MALTLGGGLLALQGCDPTVRDTVLTGVGSAATTLAGTFIQAFIESLQPDEEEQTPTTVMVDRDPTARIFT
jgi:hypothetical protein